jgi:hypothetical protein
MTNTDDLSSRLLRLPLWIGVERELVVRTFLEACEAVCSAR